MKKTCHASNKMIEFGSYNSNSSLIILISILFCVGISILFKKFPDKHVEISISTLMITVSMIGGGLINRDKFSSKQYTISGFMIIAIVFLCGYCFVQDIDLGVILFTVLIGCAYGLFQALYRFNVYLRLDELGVFLSWKKLNVLWSNIVSVHLYDSYNMNDNLIRTERRVVLNLRDGSNVKFMYKNIRTKNGVAFIDVFIKQLKKNKIEYIN
jgi:hypothetical protein